MDGGNILMKILDPLGLFGGGGLFGSGQNDQLKLQEKALKAEQRRDDQQFGLQHEALDRYYSLENRKLDLVAGAARGRLR